MANHSSFRTFFIVPGVCAGYLIASHQVNTSSVGVPCGPALPYVPPRTTNHSSSSSSTIVAEETAATGNGTILRTSTKLHIVGWEANNKIILLVIDINRSTDTFNHYGQSKQRKQNHAPATFLAFVSLSRQRQTERKRFICPYIFGGSFNLLNNFGGRSILYTLTPHPCPCCTWCIDYHATRGLVGQSNRQWNINEILVSTTWYQAWSLRQSD